MSENTQPQERDIDKIVAYIEARVRPTICPTFSSTGKQSIEGRITQDDFDHLIGLVQSLRAQPSTREVALEKAIRTMRDHTGMMGSARVAILRLTLKEIREEAERALASDGREGEK